MGLFGSFKKKPEKKTWMVYQDMLGTKKMSVRVDTQYIDKDYKNTFYIKASYCDSSTDDLPERAFLESLADLEEKALQEINKTFGDNIVFLGTATFGGGSYIIFASDLDVRWEDYVSSQIDKELIAGIYQNDHMGYYNQVLYPDHVRQAR